MADKTYEIILTDKQQEVVNRLRLDGIGSQMGGEPPEKVLLKDDEFVLWVITKYLRSKGQVFADEDRKTLTEEEVDAVLDARE